MREEKRLVERDIHELRESVGKLEATVHALQAELWELRHEKKPMQWNAAAIGQIGGLILGAIVLLGIFWR
ncbi:hypothetical protein MUG87_02990 [Ectobacillus sp. JY-23]|uniref:hypothetical protein n=1 Tax=Ectobacillus sp. JY-23 TaxID=2933872 RepID=UPI001FF2BAD5|nr:hypothetical protein [Ectobacillus sp. JY-23]UOY93117.1 hypothetical protein MUG87_02990 [Ectobacillus sp. JY-23]